MMMEAEKIEQECCVPGCPSGTSDFKFPSELGLARKWRRAIRRLDLKFGLLWRPRVDDTICAQHFAESDFEAQLSESGAKRLKPNAMPSLQGYTKDDSEAGSSSQQQPLQLHPLPLYRQLRNLSVGTGNNFLENWTPESSTRETRKLTRKIYTQRVQRNRIYDEKGTLIQFNHADVCDCLEDGCPGCHFPCPKCGSPKCGHECRENRRWVYDQLEVEGKDGVIRNRYK